MKHFFCPKCGHRILKKMDFCPHCGFNLDLYRKKYGTLNDSAEKENQVEKQKGIKDIDNSSDNNEFDKDISTERPKGKHFENLRTHTIDSTSCLFKNIDSDIDTPKRTQHTRLEKLNYKHYQIQKNKQVINTIIAIIICLVIGSCGLYTYSNNLFPFNHYHTEQNTTKNQTGYISKKPTKYSNKFIQEGKNNNFSNQKLETHQVWNNLQLNLSDHDISENVSSNLFTYNINNKSYQHLLHWAKLIINEDKDNKLVNATITPEGFQEINPHKISYDVKYDFPLDVSNNKHKVQIFKWTATFNHLGKIKHMKSNSYAMRSYTQNNQDNDGNF